MIFFNLRLVDIYWFFLGFFKAYSFFSMAFSRQANIRDVIMIFLKKFVKLTSEHHYGMLWIACDAYLTVRNA